MKQFLAFVAICLLMFSSGLFIGHLVTRGQTELYYYRQATSMGIDNDQLTKEEAIQLLSWMQSIHLVWYDNPQWYNFDIERQANEQALVNAYGKLTEFIERR